MFTDKEETTGIAWNRYAERIMGKMKYSIHKRGGMAMKNILKIMLMMITIFTIAGSAVYAAEIPVSDQDQLITSSDWTVIYRMK